MFNLLPGYMSWQNLNYESFIAL